MRTQEEVKHAFTPTTNLTSTQQMKIMRISNSLRELAIEMIDLVPECADRTAALRKLLECKFTCVQAITHDKGASHGEEKSEAKSNDKTQKSKN